MNLEYVSQELRERIEDFIDNPTVSFWLSEAIEENLNRDCVEALRDAEDLVAILRDVVTSIEE
jgi:hypothetical protein